MNILSLIFQFFSVFGQLILAVVGLSIIFGVMNIINFAHAAFIMLGAVFTTVLYNIYNFPLFIAIIVAALIVGIIGMFLEIMIIRKLYNRILDSLLATWAINIIIIQIILIWYGPRLRGVSIPFGSYRIWGYSFSIFSLFVFICSVGILVFLYWLFNNTRFGVKVRASMENKDLAESLGVNTSRIYFLVFGIGAFFSGLAGALFAPGMSISPMFGERFIPDAFSVVIIGGAAPLFGSFVGAMFLGLVYAFLAVIRDPFWGRLGIVFFTILAIRFLPGGFTELYEQLKQKRREGN